MKKRSKLLSILSTIGLTSVIAISAPIAFSKTSSVSVSANEILGTNQRVNLTEQTIEARWTYNQDGSTQGNYPRKKISEWEYYGKLYPSQVNSTHIKSLLFFNKQANTIDIEIIDPSDNNDFIQFKVIQRKNIMDPSTNTSIGTERVELKDIDHQVDTNTVWDTKHLGAGVFLSNKYTFSWKDPNVIAEFLKSETGSKSYESLTVEDVLTNLVEKGSEYNLPEYDSTTKNITITKTPVTTEDNDKKYGTVKLTIDFTDKNTDNWVGGVYPSEADRTIILRGLQSTDSSSTEMSLNFINNNLLNALTIKSDSTDNPLQKYLSGSLNNNGSVTNGKLTDLFPSEIAQLNEDDPNTLKSILLNGDYLNGTNKIAELKYYDMSLTSSNSKQFATTAGLSEDIVNQLGIDNVVITPYDATGALTITYNYHYYDVYTSSVKQDSKKQEFPEGTFKVNPDANKVFQFSWKDDNAIGMSSSYELVNDFKKNQNDSDYVKALSNMLFEGTTDTYSQDRTVEIDYVGGSTESGGNWTPNTINQTQVTVTITFGTWNGGTYDENNVRNEGHKETKTFTLPNYNNPINNINWKSKDSVATSLGGDISTLSTTDIANKIYTGELPLTTFVDGVSSNNVSITTNASTGSITITVVEGNNTVSQVFSGFKKESSDSISQFSWLPSSQMSTKLQMTNIEDITPEMVIEEYLSKLEAFQGITLTKDDVTLTLKPETNSIIVEVKVANYDAAYDTNKNFRTELKGFVNTTFVDANSYKAPMDLTIVLSVIFGVVVSAILIGVLAYIVVKRQRLEKARKERLSKKG